MRVNACVRRACTQRPGPRLPAACNTAADRLACAKAGTCTGNYPPLGPTTPSPLSPAAPGCPSPLPGSV